jgi:hypothetical protein
MLFKLELGDASGDGHLISEAFYVNVSDEISKAQLRANYKVNRKRLGFGYSDIADEYDSPTIRPKQIAALEEDGLTFVKADWGTKLPESYTDPKSRTDQNIVVLEEEANDKGNFYFYEEDYSNIGYIRIVMHMFGKGLEGFTWSFQDIKAESLNAQGEGNPGYGFYGN